MFYLLNTFCKCELSEGRIVWGKTDESALTCIEHEHNKVWAYRAVCKISGTDLRVVMQIQSCLRMSRWDSLTAIAANLGKCSNWPLQHTLKGPEYFRLLICKSQRHHCESTHHYNTRICIEVNFGF